MWRQIVAGIDRQGEAKVSLQTTFVELVENDCCDTFQRRIGLQHPSQDAFRNHFDASVMRHSSIHPHPIANRPADTFMQGLRHSVRDGASGEAAGLEHDDAPAGHPGLLQQGERHNRTLAGAGRRLQHRRPVRSECAGKCRQRIVNGQSRFHVPRMFTRSGLGPLGRGTTDRLASHRTPRTTRQYFARVRLHGISRDCGDCS